MVTYVDIIGLCLSVAIFLINLCDAALKSCYVAALPFQVHANYEIWSIDFGLSIQKMFIIHDNGFLSYWNIRF